MTRTTDEQFRELNRRVHYTKQRFEMVEHHMAARGVTDPAVLKAMSAVPRETFVPEELAGAAYAGGPLHIGFGQTMSQPFVQALMLEALQVGPGDRVLDVGTGSGYTAAVLSHMVSHVYSVERIRALAESAAERVDRLGFQHVHVLHGDGRDGWPEHAPYDGVLVTAGCGSVPEPLQQQLAPGGRLVVPLGTGVSEQTLFRITRVSDREFRKEEVGSVCFLPLAEGLYHNS